MIPGDDRIAMPRRPLPSFGSTGQSPRLEFYDDVCRVRMFVETVAFRYDRVSRVRRYQKNALYFVVREKK